MTRNLQSKAEQLAMALVHATASRAACLLPAHLCSWGENGNALEGEMACVESPPFWGSDDAPPGNDGMLLARVPEVAFVTLVLGQNCPTHYHPVVVGLGTFDCLGEYGLEAIARPWAWGRTPPRGHSEMRREPKCIRGRIQSRPPRSRRWCAPARPTG